MEATLRGKTASLSHEPRPRGADAPAARLAILRPHAGHPRRHAPVLRAWSCSAGSPRAPHWLPESAIPGLNAYVLFFALPCMLFRFGASLPLARLADPVLLAIYVAAALAIIALTIARDAAPRRPRTASTCATPRFGALVAAFPNAGFMGVPLLVALLGEAAAGPVIGAIVVDLVVTSTVCLALAQSQRHRARRRRSDRCCTAAALSLRGALTNPLPWAIALGAVFAATGRELPGPIAQIVRMLGDSATPVALFTIGTVLWRAGQHAHTRTPVAPLPAGGADQAARPSGAGVRARHARRARSARRSRRSR